MTSVQKKWKLTNAATCDAVNDLSTRENKERSIYTLDKNRKPWKTRNTIRKYMHKN